MISLSRFLSEKLRRFFKRSFTILFITVNITVIVINTIYIQRTLETQNENLVEMIEHLSFYADDETVITYLEHYGHTHAVTLSYETVDGAYAFQTESPPETDQMYQIYHQGALHAVIEIDNAQSNVFWSNVTYVLVLNVVVIGLYVFGLMVFNKRLKYVEETLLNDVKTVQRSIKQVSFEHRPYFEPFKAVLDHFESTYETLKTTQTTYQQHTMKLAHDIKTPLTIIQGLLEGLTTNRLKPSKSLYDSVEEEVQRIDQLVKTMIEGQKRKTLETFDMLAVIEPVIQSFKPVFENQDKTITITNPETFAVVGYQDDISRVIDHLLLNSLKHTRSHDRVEISLDHQQRMLIISDTGAGMDLKDETINMQQHTQPFGSGVGLEIVKQILTRHQASFEIESQKEEGFKAIITFDS